MISLPSNGLRLASIRYNVVMCIGMFIGMCIDMCIGMRIDMRTDMHRPSNGAVVTCLMYVYTHVCTHRRDAADEVSGGRRMTGVARPPENSMILTHESVTPHCSAIRPIAASCWIQRWHMA